ncbi:hypothetical protein CHS0354_003880 [Potamilus streckersoni]|uniref:Uncharacterized protein n=1 Tax=Potamilus streckersoni TaxID=2493646 RepID=A0AAE0WE26_9BIVA|nr:hypothetical protein CHS0354_003880 [Potamilus streckersoni]
MDDQRGKRSSGDDQSRKRNGSMNEGTVLYPRYYPDWYSNPYANNWEGENIEGDGYYYPPYEYYFRDPNLYDNTYVGQRSAKSHANRLPAESEGSVEFSESKKKICGIIAAIIVSVCLVAIALGIGIYFGVVEPSRRTSPDTKVQSVTFVGSLTLNRTFTPALNDSNSTEYKQLAENVTTEVDNAYKSSSLRDVYGYSNVTGFSSGSIVAHIKIHFTADKSSGTAVTADSINTTLNQQLKQSSSSFAKEIMPWLINLIDIAASTTPEVTTRAPTTQAPTTAASTVQVSTTFTPIMSTSITVSPTTQPSTTAESITQVSLASSTTMASTIAATSTNASTTAASTTQPSTTAASTTQPLTTAASTTQPSTTAASTTQPSTIAASTTKAPTTLAPTTSAPVTNASTTQTTTTASTTKAPTTTNSSPATAASTTQSTTTASTTKATTTTAPTTSAPATTSSTTQTTTTASTTKAPTTTTSSLATAASTTQSTTTASTSKAPTTTAPTTSAPATAASTAQSTTTAPTTKASTTASPTTSAAATIALTTQASTTASTTKAPTTAATTILASTTAASTTQASITASTTKASITASPTTSAAATIAPTTQASTTASTTKAPTTAAPTTQASTTAASTTQASTAASTTKASTTAALTTSAPATAASTAQSTTTASTTKASTTAAPTTQASTTAASTTQASTAASTTKASTTAASTTQASTTASTTKASTTASPTTSTAATIAPTTQASTTAASTTQASTAASTTKASTTAAPTTSAPATVSSTAQSTATASTTKASTTASPTTSAPATVSSTAQSTTAASTTKASTTAAPTTSAPATVSSTAQSTTTASMMNASTLASPTSSAAATIAPTTQTSITASTTKTPTTSAPTTTTTSTIAPTTQASTAAASTTMVPTTTASTTQASSTVLTTSTTTTPMATTTVIYITTTEFITTTLANVVDIVDLNMTLNQTFNEKLRDENSTEYQTLKNQSEVYLTLVLKADNSTGNATHEVDSVQVLGFEPGSLIIKSQISFRLVKMYLAGETRRTTDKSVLVEMLQSGIEKVREDPKIRIPDVFKNLTAEAVTEVITLEVKVEPCRNFSKMEEYLLGSNDGTGDGLCEASVNLLKGQINQNGGVMDNDSCSTYHDMLDCLVTQFQLIDGLTCDWNNDFIQGGFVQQSGLLSKIAGPTSAGKYLHGQCVQIWRGQYKFEDLQTLGVAQSPCTDPHLVFYTAKYFCPLQREILQSTNETGCKANLLNLTDCVRSSINMEYKQTCQVEQVADVIYDNQDYIAKSKYDIQFLRTCARGCNAPYIEYLVNSECKGPLTLFDKVNPANKCRLFEYTVSCLTFINVLEQLGCDGTAVGQYVAQRWLRIRERYPGASNYTSIPCNVTGALPTLAPFPDLTTLDICSDPDLFFYIFTFNCKAVIDKPTLLGNKSCSYHWKKYECVLNNLNTLSLALKRNNCSFDNVRAFMFPNSTNNSTMLLSKIQDKLTELSYPLDINEFNWCNEMYKNLVSQGQMCDIFLSRRADAIKEHCSSVMNYSLEMTLKFPPELKCWLAKETAICARTIISDLDPAGQCSLFNISSLLNDLVFSEMKNQQNWNTTYYSDCSALQDHTFNNLTACTSADLVGLGLLNCAAILSNRTQPCRKLDDFAICALQAAQQQKKKCDPSDIVVALIEYEWLLNNIYTSCHAGEPCTDLVLMKEAWKFGGCSVRLDKVQADLCSAAFSTAECVANFISTSKGKTCSQDGIGMTLLSKMEDILLMAGENKTTIQEYVRAYAGFDPESCPGRGTLCPLDTFSMLLQGNCSAPLGVMHNPETTESEICGAYGDLLECLAFHMMLAGKDQCKMGSIHNTILKNLTRVVYTSSGRSIIQDCQGLNLDKLQARIPSPNEGSVCSNIPIIQYYVKYLACQRQLDAFVSQTGGMHCGAYFGIVNGLSMFFRTFGFHCEYTKLMRLIQEHEANDTQIDKIFPSRVQLDQGCHNLYNMTVANSIPKARCEMFMANYSCEVFECAQPSVTIRNKTIFDSSLKCSVYYLSVKCLDMLMSKYEPDLACNYTVVGQLMNKFIDDYSTWSGQNSTSVTNFTQCTALDKLDQLGDICESDTLVALASMTCPEYLPMIRSNMSMNATHFTPVPNGQFQNTTNQQSCSSYQNLVRCGQQATASLGYHCQVSKIEMNFQNNSMLHLANLLPQSDVPSKCSLTGTLFSVKIQLNMEWKDILADPFSTEHKELVGKIHQMTSLLSGSQFGKDMESVRVISIGSTYGKFVAVDDINTRNSTPLPPPSPSDRIGSSTPSPSPNSRTDRSLPLTSPLPPHNDSETVRPLSSSPSPPINGSGSSTLPPSPYISGSGSSTPPPSPPISGSGSSTLPPSPSISGSGSSTPPPSQSPPINGSGSSTPPPSPSPPINGSGSSTPPPSSQPNNVSDRLTPPQSTLPPNNNYSQSLTTLSSPPPLLLNGTGGSLPPPNGTLLPPPPTDKTVGRRRRDILSDGGIPIGTPMPTSSMPPIGIPLPPALTIVLLELKMRPDAKFTEEEVRIGLYEAVKEMLTRNPNAEIITDIDLQYLSVYFSQGTTVDKCRDPNLIRSAWSKQVCQADLRTFISGDHISMCREFSQFVTCMIRYIQDHQMQTCTYKEVRDTLVENFESLLKELGLDQSTVTRVLYIFSQGTCYSAECTSDEFLLAALQTRCQVDWAVFSNVNIDQSTKCSRYHSTINCIQMIIGNPGACSDDIILSTFISNMDYILPSLNVDPNLIRVTFSPYNCTSSKPGFCPVSVLAGTCVMECSSDYACNGSKKCCYNNCGYTCQNPVSKPQCPTEMFKTLIFNNCSGPYNHLQNPSLGVVDGCRFYEDLLQCIAFHMIMSGNNMCTVELIHHILMQQYAYILTRSDGASLANCTNTDWALLQAEIPGKSNEEVCRSIPTMQYYMKYVACDRNFKFSINLTDEVRCGIAFGILNGIQSFFHGFGFNCEFTQLMSTVSSHEQNSTLENKLLPPYLLGNLQTCQAVYFNGSLSSDPRLQCALIMANYRCPVVESLSPLLKMRNTTVYTSDLKCSVYYEFIKRVKTLLNKTVAYLPCNNEMLKTMVNGFIEGYWMESGQNMVQALDFAECTALETVNQLGSLCNQDTLVALSVMFCPARTQYGSILTTADPRTGSTQESSGMAVSTSWGEFCYTYQSLVQCGLQIANSTDFGYNCSHGDTEILFERVERDNYGLLLNSLPGGLNPTHCSKYSSMFNINLKLDHKWTDSLNNASSPEYMGMIQKIKQSMDRLVNESFLSSYVAEVKVIQIGSWSGWMATLQIGVNMTVKMKSTARLHPQEVSGGLIRAIREFTQMNTSDEIIPNIDLYFIYVEPVSTEPSICTRETFKDLEGTVCHQFVNVSLLTEEWELCRMYVDLLKCFRLHMLLYHEDDCTFSRIDRIMMAAKTNVFKMKEGFVRTHCSSYFNLTAEEYNVPADGTVCSSMDMIQNVMSECNAKKVNMTMLDTDSICRIRTGAIPCINETFASHNFLCDRDKIRSTVLSLPVGNGNCTAMYNAANRCDRYMMENYQVANHCGIIMFYITKSIIMKKSDLMCKVYYEFLNCVHRAGSVASFCSDLQMLDPVARGVLKLVHRTDADLNTYFDSPDFSNCTGLANATVGNICQDPQKLTAVSLANCSVMVQMYIYPYSTCMRYNYLVSCGRETAAALGSARCDLETVHQAFTNNSALVRQQFPNENFSHCVMDECISVENQPKIAEAFSSCGILQLWSKLVSKQSFLDSLLYDQDIICRLFKMTTDCLVSRMSQLVGVNCNPAAIRDLITSNMQNLNQNLTNALQVCPVTTTDLIPVCEDKPFISKMFLVVNEYLLSDYIRSTMWGDLCMFNSVLINSTIASLWSYSGVHCTSLQIREALVNQTHFLSNTANITDISRCMGTDACSDPLLDVCRGTNMCTSLTYDRMPDCTTWLGTLKYIQLQTQKLYGLKCPLESLSKAYYHLTRTDAQKCLVTTYHEVTYSMNRTWDPTYKEVDFYLIKLFMYGILNEVKMALALKTSDLSALIITDFSEGEIIGNGTMMVKVHMNAGFSIALSDVKIQQLFVEGIMARQTNISADPLIREILIRTITVSNQTFTPDQNTAFCRDPSVLQRVGNMYCYANWTGFCSDSTVQYQIVSCVYQTMRSVQANCSFRDVRQTLVSIPRISKSCHMLVREGPGCPAMPDPYNCTTTCTADEYCNDGKLCCTSSSCASTICMKPDVEGYCNASNNIAAVLMLEECGIRKFIPEGLSPFPDNQTKCSFLMNATQCLLRDSMFREICNVTAVMNRTASVPAQLTALLRELNVSQNLFGTNFNHSICANYRNMTGNITVYQYSGVLTLEREYQPELLNRSSLQFRNLEMEIIRELNRTFSSGSLNRTYLNSSVQGFRNGSVIVYFKSAFSANISVNDVLSTLIVGLVSSNSSIAGEIRPNSGSILNQTEEGLTACRNESLITYNIQKCANESAFGNLANEKNCTLYFRVVQCVMRPIEQKYFTYCSPGDVITAVAKLNALIPLGNFNNTILECPEYLYLRKLAVQETIPPSA